MQNSVLFYAVIILAHKFRLIFTVLLLCQDFAAWSLAVIFFDMPLRWQ